ncbi:MAG TPA: proprotein convertase P-domain-containing protein [Solirubrobacteraceae bacterium]|jgi:subtilisin-like proprotein convertase family protein
MRPYCRSLALLTATLALGATGAGTAGAHAGHAHALGAPALAPASAYAGLTKRPGGRCGSLYEVRTKDKQGHERIGCTHGPDPAPAGARPAGRTPSIADLRADAALAGDATGGSGIACDSENSAGMRVTLVYAYTTDQADRYAEVAPLMRQWAAEMEDIYYESARETGGTRSIRWLTEPTPTGACRLKVEKVALTPTGDDSFSNTMTEIRNDHGMTSLDRRFQVWMDGSNSAGICGIGEFNGDDSPGAGNTSNGGVATGYYGLVSRVDADCWGAFVGVHELGHTLGAVSMTAPHTTGGAHCFDEWDVMCYFDSAQSPAMTYVCGTKDGDSSHASLLDCNHDDYYSTSPPAGSYLATHWNVANNNFLRQGQVFHDATAIVSTEDGDAIPEPGETVAFTERVKNRSTVAATGVSGMVLSADATSTPVAGTKAYPDIPGLGTGTNVAPHQVTIKSTTPCGAVVPLTVRITASDGKHDVPVAIPTGAPGAPSTTSASPGIAIPDGDATGVTTSMTLPAGGRVADVDIKLNITHTYDGDVQAFLIHPDGTTVKLFAGVGDSGHNFTDTVLDDEAATSIVSGTAPFTGSFRPEGSLAALDGKPIGGVWELKLVDTAAQDTGTLTSWGITRRAPACSPPPATTPDPSGWSAAPATAKGDLDGDGRSDLVVGAPGENAGRGAVHVLYGTANGLAATGSQQWTQDSAGIAETAEPDDRFGASVAVGDLNGDGRADVAIGAPGEDAGATNAGAVHVLYGSSGGLTATGSQLWQQGGGGAGETPEAGDRFGSALAIGDLGKSAHADLAVGVPDEDLAGADAGVVQVRYGSAGGLTATGAQLWSQGSGGLGETAEAGDRFGAALAIGALGRTAQRDLAIGAPWEDLNGVPDAGAVHVVFGSTTGLAAADAQVWSQNSAGVDDAAEAADHFGASLAAGDLGQTTVGDLAIGVPDENLAVTDAGLVHVLYGTSTGPAAAGSQLWSQESAGIADAAEAGDRFGAALAVGNYGRTAQADLAIGVPSEDLGVADAGLVHAVYGTAAGLVSDGSQLWSQATAGIDDEPESGDRFGSRLATGQYGRGTQDDLVVGVPGEDAGGVDAGLAHALYGTATGLSAANSQLWSQASADVAGTPGAGDAFGSGVGR